MDPDRGQSPLYGAGARALQDRFDSRRLADRLSEVTVTDALSERDREMIARQSALWLGTVDAAGWPDVSYKGGAPGFVVCPDDTTVEVPVYDGNGMFRSTGNIVDTGRAALLFTDPGRGWRLRIHGTASVSVDEADLAGRVGAIGVIVVRLSRAFPNCGRYLHPGGEIGDDTPRDGHTPPLADWKRWSVVRDALPVDDLARLADESPEDR
ncbi:MAG: pyridoxamine 5'-phosphate oxidase family protein [Acidimicrobiales bacterium]